MLVLPLSLGPMRTVKGPSSSVSTPISGDPELQSVEVGRAEIVVHVARRAPVGEVPPLHPRHAFTPVQPEPRCRDLGTLGPRGPPLTQSG